jgi:1-deoxy-D-xylulose-5-phosphate synthase
MEIKAGPILSTINNPDDLKKISREQLHQVCDELRQYIIDVVSVHGGHFAASLGLLSLVWHCIIFIIHPTINWFGM